MKDCLVPVKLLFFEEVAKKLNEFLVVFQTDKPMAPFLMGTLEDLIKSLMRKFIHKDLCESCSEMANTRAVLSILISFVLLISAFFIILDAQNSVVAACSQGCLFVIDF